MRPVAFGEPLPAGARLTLISDDKPDRFFTVIKFWMDETSGVALALKTGVPTYQVEDEEGSTHLLIRVLAFQGFRYFLGRFRKHLSCLTRLSHMGRAGRFKLQF